MRLGPRSTRVQPGFPEITISTAIPITPAGPVRCCFTKALPGEADARRIGPIHPIQFEGSSGESTNRPEPLRRQSLPRHDRAAWYRTVEGAIFTVVLSEIAGVARTRRSLILPCRVLVEADVHALLRTDTVAAVDGTWLPQAVVRLFY